MQQITTEPSTSSSMRLAPAGRKPAEIVEAWHSEQHFGAFWVCQEQPCHAVNKYLTYPH